MFTHFTLVAVSIALDMAAAQAELERAAGCWWTRARR